MSANAREARFKMIKERREKAAKSLTKRLPALLYSLEYDS